MKTRVFITVAVLFFTLGPPVSWSIENLAIRNPVGSSTLPPSSINSGLVNTPNPIDSSGNLVMTGNVRRGRHFRATVPYRSTTTFSSPVGSSFLSSFLRDSAGSEDLGRGSGRGGLGSGSGGNYEPYYLPARTVTTATPGRAGVFRPTNTRSNNIAQDAYGLESFLKKSTTGQSRQGASAQPGTLWGLSGLESQIPQTRYGTLTNPESMSLSPRSTQRLIPSQVDRRRQSEITTVEQYRRQRQDSALGADRLEAQDSKLSVDPKIGFLGAEQQQRLPETDDLSQYSRLDPRYSNQETILDNRDSNFGMQVPAESTAGARQTDAAGYRLSALEELTRSTEPALQQDAISQSSLYSARRLSGPDVLGQIRQQLDDLVESIKAQESQDSRPRLVPSRNQDLGSIFGPGLAVSEPEESSQKINTAPAEQYLRSLDKLSELPRFPDRRKGIGDLSQADLPAGAKRIMGPHNSRESFSQAKFTQHMRAAEDYLKTGRYYRAANSFALASIYRPDDAPALAGKGHALFAAGEYVSSALFLSRALEIAPEYVQTRIDLGALLGEAGKLTGRITDVERWFEASAATELQFLLGYVYYRTGRLSQAKQAIDAVREKMPQSPAVQALGTAIYDAIAGH